MVWVAHRGREREKEGRRGNERELVGRRMRGERKLEVNVKGREGGN